ncbi:alpha/beta hydrolase [Clostridiaceae bacterium M8S5]|nr:alpha/beta hydrolase [Clostridiaceae bacterium M8S5]
MSKVIFKSENIKREIINFYNKTLERWPVNYEEITINTKYGDTHILVSGNEDNPPLVLIHGSASNSAMWIGDIENYAKHFRVYMIDIPGEPGKSQEIRFDIKTSESAKWLDNIISELNIKKFCLGGISFGGWIALDYSINNPGKVEKLVLLCPAGIGRQKFEYIPYLVFMSLLGQYGAKKNLEKICYGEEVDSEAFYFNNLISKGFNPRMKLPIFEDKQLKKLKMKTFLLLGKKDIMIDSKKTLKRAINNIPNLNYKMLVDKGHGLINKSKHIIDFLLDEV